MAGSGRMKAERNWRSRERAKAREAAGITPMQGVLEQLESLAKDMSIRWADIGAVWAERQQQIFDTDSLGRWAPLSAETILRKRRAGIVMDTMVETGTLRRSLTNAVPRAQGPHFAVFGPPVGAPIDYAKFHARGNGVPQRNPVPRLSPAERKRMVDLLRLHRAIG